MENKKGFTTLTLFGIIFIGLFLMIILGVVIYVASTADDTISQIDYDIGNISFSETYNETLKPGLTAVSTTVPKVISTATLLGLVLCMMLVGYNTKKIGKLWLVLDIVIILIAEVAAVAVSSSFTTFINSSPEMLEIFSTTLSVGSKYILRLPTIVPTVGVLIMVATHILGKQREEEATF